MEESINLDGLVAAEESNLDFNEPPMRRFIYEVNLESLSNKRQGIFIVDFVGNGLCSRAVIRKGKLAYIESQTVAGQLFTLLDEEANVCSGDHTGMWIKDRFYHADEKGRVLVPFSQDETKTAVLVHGDYAELVDISLRAEDIEFVCGYIYNHESFLTGNRATVLVQPRLFLNNHLVGLDIITECSATVICTDYDQIPRRSYFHDLTLSTDKEIELDFIVPAKLEQIKIIVTAKITPINKHEPKEFSSSKVIQMDRDYDCSGLCNPFLKLTDQGYELHVLGKNGEPKSGALVDLSFESEYHTELISQTMQTNEHGKISLGSLDGTIRVEAHLQPFGQTDGQDNKTTKEWNLNFQPAKKYPEKIRICENEEIVLPLHHNELNRHKILFVETLEDGSVVRNLITKLKIHQKMLIISGLAEGIYSLWLKDIDETISIYVSKGAHWHQNNKFILSNNILLDTQGNNDNIVITDVKLYSREDDPELVDILIKTHIDQPKLARFHIFAAQFIDSDRDRIPKELYSCTSEDSQTETSLEVEESQFLNNKNIGEEYRYILDRKSKARFIGNNLEKPPVLLKRTFLRETEKNEEDLEDSKEFEPSVAKRKSAQFAGGVGKPRRYRAGCVALREIRSSGSKAQASVAFLASPCQVYSNLRTDQDGTVTIQGFPHKKYSFIQIVGTNLTSNISKIVALGSFPIQTRDLTQKTRDSSACVSERRTNTIIRRGEDLKVKDVAQTETHIIDSISKVFEIQEVFDFNKSRSTKLQGVELFETVELSS